MPNWTIYMYTFPNDKKYIGATKRSLCHRQGSCESGWAGYKNCRLLWEAIQEFGIDNIEQTILFKGEISNQEAAEMERHYIEMYKTNANKYQNPSFGYNLGPGGEGTGERHHTEEFLKASGERIRGQALLHIGKSPSASTRYRQRMAKLGTKRGPLSEETKRKIGLANSLAMISDEERMRRSNSKKQPVIATNPKTGEQLFFESGYKAADYFGVQSSAISRWIKGTRNPTNGYIFEKAKGKEAS